MQRPSSEAPGALDALITPQIAAAVDFVSRELGRPLLDLREKKWIPRPGDSTNPIWFRAGDVSAVTAIAYWTPAGELRAAADGVIALNTLGRIELDADDQGQAAGENLIAIYPPAAGWPEVLADTCFRVSYTRLFNVEATPSVRQAVIVVVRQFYVAQDPSGAIWPSSPMWALIRPWQRRVP